MYRKATIALALLSTSFISQASLIQNITGADMGGMLVTAVWRNGNITSDVWTASGMDSGEASYHIVTDNQWNGNGWTLTQNGDTIGEVEDGVEPGIWTLTSKGVNITSLLIQGLPGNILFDNLFGDDNLNGSNAGRAFTYDNTPSVNASFSDQYLGQPDLYGTMLLTGTSGNYNDLLGANGSLQFMVDTDAIAIPEPNTIFVIMAGLFGLMFSRKTIEK